MQSRIEVFGINRFKLSTERARSSLHTLIELLRNPAHRTHLLRGNPPPLSAMLAPALGESFSRWEETASGFSGHGFNDQEKERYVPEHLEAGDPIISQTLVEWAIEQRARLSERASQRMRHLRASWFGWTLKMRQLDNEEVTRPQTVKPDNPSLDHKPKASEPHDVRRISSWVWEWSRNKPP